LANTATVKMILAGGASNAQRMTSLGSFGFPGTAKDGNEVTVVTALLSAAKNSTIGNISAVYNQTGVTIGSYLVTAGAAEGVDVSKFIFEDCTTTSATDAGDNNLGAAFSNLTLWYGSTQLGSTIIPNPTVPAATYEFNPSTALSLATGQTVKVDLKGDVITGAAWLSGDGSCLMSIESTGKVTTNAANFTTGVVGQAITLSGSGLLSGATDPSTPDVAIVAMGDTEKVMGVWKLSANTVEPLNVSKIMVFDDVTAGNIANIKNLKLYCGSAQFGAAVEGLLPAVAGYGWVDPYAVFGGACVVPKGGNTLITLKADITTYGDGGQAGQFAKFYITVPAAITGATADAILARGAGDYASTAGTAASSSANLVYPYRTSLTAALACSGSCTGRTRSATDKVAVLTLTGTNSADAKLRADLELDDESTTTGSTTGWSASSSADTAVKVTAASSTALDSTYSIQYNASSSALGQSYILHTPGVSLNAYTKLSLWIKPAAATAGAVFVTNATTTAYASATAAITTGVMTPDEWNYVELSLAGIGADTKYVGYSCGSTTVASTTAYLDAIKVYTESITVNVSGNATDAGRAYPVYLKTAGGTQKALGYFDYDNLKVVLIPTAEIAVGATPVALEMITDTTKVIEAQATGISRTLTLSSYLGTYDDNPVGDIAWWDQANTTPITWMNGASPISVTLSLATGN